MSALAQSRHELVHRTCPLLGGEADMALRSCNDSEVRGLRGDELNQEKRCESYRLPSRRRRQFYWLAL
jgi:hypothetical protein